MRKFKCISYKQDDEKNFIVGKIYYGEDGSGIKCDNGFVYDCYRSIDEVIDFLSKYYEFEEVFDEEIKEDKEMGKFIKPKLDNDTMIEKLDEYCGERNCDDCVFENTNDRFDDMTDEELLSAYNLAFGNDQSKVVNNSESTFTITTSDTTTTLTDGTHTTTINRYHTDKHDDMVALEEVVKKYKSEMEEIERKSKESKVGDKVRIIDHKKTHSRYDEWLIKNNVNLKSAIKWINGLSPKNGGKYTIKEIHKLTYSDIDLALIEDEKNAYIINIEGLEVIK